MGLDGRAVLAIWHDIREGSEDEFNRWHTREHMPERVATPGITVGRRYADYRSTSFRYFTLYEADSFDVFASDGYFATANSPSPWTVEAQQAFYNFARQPCHIVMTRGAGVGGALATLRVTFPTNERSPGDPDALAPADAFNTAARTFVEGAMALDHVVGAHVAIAAKIDRLPVRKTAIQRRPGGVSFDGAILVEAIGRPQLEAVKDRLVRLVEAEKTCVGSCVTGVYDLAWYLPADRR